MAWIKFEKDLLTDPRVLRVARALQNQWTLGTVSEPVHGVEFGNAVALPAVTLVCGALVRIWSLADTHLGSDDILPLGIDELDEVVGVPGFCALLPPDWLISIDEHSVKLPEFHAHNGTEAKKKAVTQKRVARFRERNSKPLPISNAHALPDQTRPDYSKPTTAANEKITLSPEGVFVGIRPDQVSLWRKAYPAVSLDSEISAAAAWIVANPANKKSNYARFITNWLKRQQDKAPRMPSPDQPRRVAL